MKKPRRNRFQVELDFTSLMDVIFILLMIVMCYAYVSSNGIKKDMEKLEAAKKHIETEKNYLAEQLDNYNEEENKVYFVSVFATYDKGSPKKRTLELIRGSNSEIGKYQVDEANADNANVDNVFEAFRTDLENYISKSIDGKEKPIIISISSENILYRDHKKLETMLNEIRNKYDNVLICEE